jgi:hypothetical protein
MVGVIGLVGEQTLKLPRFRGRFAGIDYSFTAVVLASYSMGER